MPFISIMKLMKSFTPLTILLFFFICADLFPQSRIENKSIFYDAESWILFEDYKEALPLYQQLIESDPDNSNYKYRIGQCYINMPGEKEKAITFLEEAVKNINPRYREGRFSETGAPHDALYYLANAYGINNQLDKALETYELFKVKLNTKIYDTAVVNLQIRSCHNAKVLMSTPLYIREHNLGNTINKASSEFNPVISDDETIMVFSKSLAFYDATLYSTKVNGSWTEPQNMNELLKIDRDIYPTSLSRDGRVLYLYNSENYDGNIFTTSFENGIWSPIVKLNDNINTKYWESHAAISHDNNRLYFTSNRKNTIGGLDIFVSQRDTAGNWGPAVNLGPVINTPYNEETPFLSKDDRTLFFSSRGHYNMGGHDIFYSTLLENGEWSVPLNAGYPLNTTDDDLFFRPLNDGFEGYFAKYSPDGFGLQDIYRIEIYSDEHPLTYESDTLSMPDTILPKTILITSMNIDSIADITLTSADSLISPLKSEPDSGLTAEHQKKAVFSQPIASPEYGSKIAEKQAEVLSEIDKKSTDENVAKKAAPTDVPPDITEPEPEPGPEKGCSLWYVWLIAGTGLVVLFIILARKKKTVK